MNINLTGVVIRGSCSGQECVYPMEIAHIKIVSSVSPISVILYLSSI